MRGRYLALAAALVVLVVDDAGLAAGGKVKRRKVLRRVRKERGDHGGMPAIGKRRMEVDAEAERESRSIERNVGLAGGLLVPSQPEPPPEYLPYHYDQQKYRARDPEYYLDARDLVARDLVALESQVAEDVYNEPQYDTSSYVYGVGDGGGGGGAEFTHPYMYPYEADQVGYAPPSGAFGGGGFLQVNPEDDEVCMRYYTGLHYEAVPRFGEFCSFFCLPLLLILPAAFLQPGNGLIEIPCMVQKRDAWLLDRPFTRMPSFLPPFLDAAHSLFPRS